MESSKIQVLQRNPYTAAFSPTSPASPKRLVKGVILAGVHDWGGCALDAVKPRPLVPVAGRPLIEYAKDWLTSAGLTDITICSNLSASRLLEPMVEPPGEHLTLYQDIKPRGPAGCLLDAWAGSSCGTCVLVDGTTIPQFDLPALLAAHETSGAAMTVVVYHDPEHARLSDFHAPVGVYIVSSTVLEHIAESGYVDLKEGLIPRLYEQGVKVAPYFTERATPRVTGVESYLAANYWLLETRWESPQSLNGFEVCAGGAWIHPTVRVHSGARLIGPVQADAGSEISDGAILVGPVCVGRDCRIHEEAVVCRSVIWDDSVIGRGAHLDRCVVSDGVRVRPRACVTGEVLTAGSAHVEGSRKARTSKA